PLFPNHKDRSMDIHIRQMGDNTTVNNSQPRDVINSQSRINNTTFLEREHSVRSRRMPVRNRVGFDVLEYRIGVVVANSWAGTDFAVVGSSSVTGEFRMGEDFAKVFEGFYCYLSI